MSGTDLGDTVSVAYPLGSYARPSRCPVSARKALPPCSYARARRYPEERKGGEESSEEDEDEDEDGEGEE
eukprot:2892848-Rhodomonas_salina.2